MRPGFGPWSDEGAGGGRAGHMPVRGVLDELTQFAGVAWPGQGHALGRGDDGGHAHGQGKGVLHGLDVLQVEEVAEGEVRGFARRTGDCGEAALADLLQALALGDVRQRQHGPEALQGQGRCGGLDITGGPVGPADLVLLLDHLLLPDGAHAGVFIRPKRGAVQVQHDELALLGRQTYEPFARAAEELLGCAVDLQEAARDVGDGQGQRQVLEHDAVLLAALAQVGLGLLAHGDVGHGAHDALGLALGVVVEGAHEENVAQAALAVRGLGLEDLLPPVGDEPGVHVGDARHEVRGAEVIQAAAQDVLLRVAQEFAEGPVHPRVTAFHVPGEDGCGIGVHEGGGEAVLGLALVLGLPELGQVRGGGQKARDAALGVAQAEPVHLEVGRAASEAVQTQQDRAGRLWGVCGCGRQHGVDGLARFVGLGQVEDASAGQGPWGGAADGVAAGVGEDDAPGQVQLHHADGERLHELAVAALRGPALGLGPAAAQDVHPQEADGHGHDREHRAEQHQPAPVALPQPLGRVQDDAVPGQVAKREALVRELAVVEHGRVGALQNHGDVVHVLAAEDAHRQSGHGLALVRAADHHAAHGVVPQQEVPDPEDGLRGVLAREVHELRHIHALAVGIAEQAHVQDGRVRGQGGQGRGHLAKGRSGQLLHLHPAQERLHRLQGVLAVVLAGFGGVGDDRQPPHGRHELEGRLDGALDVHALGHAGVALLAAQAVRAVVVDPAEDHGRAGEQAVAVGEQKIQGVVVAGEDGIKLDPGVFLGVEVGQQAKDLLRGLALGVHVLHMDHGLRGQAGHGLYDAGLDVVRPLVALVVGVQDQDVLHGPGLAGGGGTQHKSGG